MQVDKCKREGIMEITTVIGCPIRCRYCPQDKLIKAYTQRSNIFRMDFNTFKKCLDKIPSYIRIDFSGMAEPWINPECTKMVLYSYRRGFKIIINTTLVGMTLVDLELIKGIPFEEFVVHLPDKEGYTKIMISENYLAIL